MKRNLVPAWILLQKDCFPRYLEKFPIFQGFRGFLSSIVNKEIAWKPKQKYEQRDYAFSLFLSLTLKKKKVTESDIN